MALTTTSAPTIRPFPRWLNDVPIPPLTALLAPNTLPTEAPVPAPTDPCSIGPGDALWHASYPLSGRGRTEPSPTPRSNIIADETIGTTFEPTITPIPRSSRYFIAPSAAARP